MLSSLLRTHEIANATSSDTVALSSALSDQLPGALIVTQEALTTQAIAIIHDHLVGQPEWSELTVFVLVERGASHAAMAQHLADKWPGSRQIFYQRPLATIELLSGIQAALLARLRQRDVRDHIALELELRHELNHRVKNILASVTAIFRMTARNSDSLEELTQGFSGRLKALGSVHSALFEVGGEAIDIHELITLILSPYGSGDVARYRLSGPAVSLNKDAAANLSLTMHELTTNAIKYGAWSVPTGQISVEWRLDGQEFWLRWQETGGPQLAEPTHKGYGTRYIRSALQTLFGGPPQLRFEPQGLFVEAHGPRSRIENLS
ncbi:sensor histidine kinase [Notoacmeibacter sp. MSK16QG-6]|uniref:sensor histidine kinase n=1 Tax=Notoacmeibacter sp. MSK16QG-6 TaxID=2957982 RepID=UPI0020A1A3F3|nr:sensor histidine kinase [Notoacmeibacter sp. MSK16QG-6]MCP1200852.1 sensor histidine kinase [Notoacmeibacter sp. MSK16QG-6]